MSQHDSKACPNCGGKELTDQGGFGVGTEHTAVHAAVHGFRHGNPLMLAIAAGAAAARLLSPRKYTCLSCGHCFKG